MQVAFKNQPRSPSPMPARGLFVFAGRPDQTKHMRAPSSASGSRDKERSAGAGAGVWTHFLTATPQRKKCGEACACKCTTCLRFAIGVAETSLRPRIGQGGRVGGRTAGGPGAMSAAATSARMCLHHLPAGTQRPGDTLNRVQARRAATAAWRAAVAALRAASSASIFAMAFCRPLRQSSIGVMPSPSGARGSAP